MKTFTKHQSVEIRYEINKPWAPATYLEFWHGWHKVTTKKGQVVAVPDIRIRDPKDAR